MTKKLEQLIKQLRPGQNTLAQWNGGQMAVSAVPGSGKSHSLAIAGALTIARQKLNLQRQLIVVTYTRSATASIKQKIDKNLQDLGLAPMGFSVQTIHGLALNIATQYPEFSQLNLNNSILISPNSNHRIIRKTVDKWIKENPLAYESLIEGVQSFEGEESEKLRRQDIIRTEVLPSFTDTVIKEAKSSGLTPDELDNYAHYIRDQYQSGKIASSLYQNYQILMKENNFIDYDDMILGALKVLRNPEVRRIWQQKTYAVFEDEAQDSSPLQVELLEILASDDQNPQQEPNLVRVGDPNQAINSTFTPADPVYFDWFCDRCQENNRLVTIAQAGRSTAIIMDAANKMLSFVNEQISSQPTDNQQKTNHPFRPQHIKSVAKNDPQKNANPAPYGKGLEIHQPTNIYETVKLIGSKIVELFATEESRKTQNLAILVKDKNQAKFVVNHLEYLSTDHNLQVKLIDDKTNFSHLPLEILQVLQFLDRPHSPEYFRNILDVFHKRELINLSNQSAKYYLPEQFLYPTEIEEEQNKEEKQARKLLSILLQAKLELVHYQLIPYSAMTLNYSQAELATAHKLSERIQKEIVGRSSLKTTIYTLKDLIDSEKFEGIETAENEADNLESVYTRCGQVTIMTMHKSKGLDWDYVFLPFLHQDNIPGSSYISNKTQFLGDFSLPEVVRGQLRFLVHQEKLHGKITRYLSTSQAWEEAEILKQNESYRLLYVAMTRAKKLLWMSAAKKSPFNWAFFTDGDVSNLKEKPPCPVIDKLAELNSLMP